MKIKVIGANMDIGQSLTSYVEEHLNKEVKKYFENAVEAEVHFSKEGAHLVKTMIYVNEGVKGGINVKSNGEAGEAYGSFSEALERAAKQLRRYKRRIKNYRRQGQGLKSAEPSFEILDAIKYVIPPSNLDAFADMEDGENKIEQDEIIDENPEIISEKTTKVERLSVNEAIMKMDLADLPALAFINSQNGRLNVVYHRKDGNISWVDPK
jgi:ribosomal subunit interface protein